MSLDLYQIADLTETFDFELKKAAGKDGQGQLPDNFFSTYSAMANTEGGVVLLGIEEVADGSNQVFGIINPTKVISELWTGLNNKEKVSGNILNADHVQIIELEKKQVI